MAADDTEDDVLRVPDAGPLLARAAVDWLDPMRRQLAEQHDGGRLPHGILLTGAPGAGQAEIATWLAHRVLCRGKGRKPCGACADCRLFQAGNHPDYRWVSVQPEKKEISIDQMRALSEACAMRSYRGGAKIAVISPAEAMNLKAFNALLKVLEEPPADTYFVLAASRVDRIPKTIMSRTSKLRLALPGQSDALAWLTSQSVKGDLPAILALAGGAPFLAAEYAEAGFGEIDEEMQAALAAASTGQFDIISFADRSAKHAPAARLVWLESWLTRSLREAAAGRDSVSGNRLPWLRPPGLDRKIRAGYALLDQLREARRQVGGPLNTQLLFEGLSVSLAALVGKPARRSGEGRD